MKTVVLLGMMAAAIPAAAQDNSDDPTMEEIIVTGTIASDYDPDIIPAVRLTRRADFMIQKVRIVNDTRKEDMRRDEIYATIKSLLDAAKNSSTFTLGTGSEVFVPMTESNYQLSLYDERSKADTSYVTFLVKAPLSGDAKANDIAAEINAFIQDAAVTGRSEVTAIGDLGLSIVHPQRYRKEVIAMIAADVKETLAVFGDGFSIRLEGMEWPLLWERQGLATMSLYIPYSYEIVPADD